MACVACPDVINSPRSDRCCHMIANMNRNPLQDSLDPNQSVSTASTFVFNATSSCVPSSSRSPVSPLLATNTSESSPRTTAPPSVSLGSERYDIVDWSHVQPNAVCGGGRSCGSNHLPWKLPSLAALIVILRVYVLAPYPPRVFLPRWQSHIFDRLS